MLRHECEAGFALSCYRLMHQGTPPDDAMKARVLSLARAGCRELIENECNVLNFGEISSDASSPRDLVVSPADRQLHADRMCLLYLDWCEYVSTDYRERGELVRARDVEEQVCQYGGDRSQRYCLRLSEYYIDGLLPEPVVGRGEALIAWACGGGELPREPKCKEWAAKHPVRSRTSR
jgi:hypothetical protein